MKIGEKANDNWTLCTQRVFLFRSRCQSTAGRVTAPTWRHVLSTWLSHPRGGWGREIPEKPFPWGPLIHSGPFHKHLVKSPKYLAWNSQTSFRDISKNLPNITYFCFKTAPFLNHFKKWENAELDCLAFNWSFGEKNTELSQKKLWVFLNILHFSKYIESCFIFRKVLNILQNIGIFDIMNNRCRDGRRWWVTGQPQSWYQETAQLLVDTLLSFLQHNKLP